MTTVRSRAIRAALTGVLITSGVALAGCAQVPASELVATCTPPSGVQVEHVGSGFGPVIQDGGIAEFTIAASAADGTELIPETPLQSAADGSPAPINVDQLDTFGLSSVKASMRCARAGDRITAQIPASEFFAALGGGAADGLAGDVTVRVRVTRVYHSAATGRILPQQNGLPAVVTAPDGTPGVTMPNEPAPTALRSGTTIAGNGPALAAGNVVTVHYAAFAWNSGTPITSSWGSAPVQTVVGAQEDGMFGATAELQGVPVGSQRVVVLPASVLAQYGAENLPIGMGDALVLVFDVLGSDPGVA